MPAVVIVSVIIPAYNAGRFIGDAVRHALEQTIRAIEVIVVDDGSTDSTVQVVRQFRDPRVRLIQQENSGPSAARNRGIAAATGKYVAFLDADDWWSPTKIETQLIALTEHPEARWGYSAAVRVTPDDAFSDTLAASIDGVVLSAIMTRNCISGSASSVIVEASLLTEVGGFDEDLGYAEDWDLWARLAATSCVVAVREPHVFIRVLPNSYGRNIEKMKQDSLLFLERAFNSFATSVLHKRSEARSWVYFLAGLGHREVGNTILAVGAFLHAISLRPSWPSPYKALLATFLTRRVASEITSSKS